MTGHVRCVAIEASTASRIVQTLDTATRGNRTEANFGGRKGCAITVRTALKRVCVRLTSRAKARIASASGTARFARRTPGCSRAATTRRDRRDNAGFRGVVRNVVIRHAASAHDGRQESQCTRNAKLRYTQRGHDMSITLLSQASRYNRIDFGRQSCAMAVGSAQSFSGKFCRFARNITCTSHLCAVIGVVRRQRSCHRYALLNPVQKTVQPTESSSFSYGLAARPTWL